MTIVNTGQYFVTQTASHTNISSSDINYFSLSNFTDPCLITNIIGTGFSLASGAPITIALNDGSVDIALIMKTINGVTGYSATPTKSSNGVRFLKPSNATRLKWTTEGTIGDIFTLTVQGIKLPPTHPLIVNNKIKSSIFDVVVGSGSNVNFFTNTTGFSILINSVTLGIVTSVVALVFKIVDTSTINFYGESIITTNTNSGLELSKSLNLNNYILAPGGTLAISTNSASSIEFSGVVSYSVEL